jgi:DNA-binding transcriptional regulator YiaG
MNYYDFVAHPEFFSFLLEIDRSIAAEAHAHPCSSCGDRLNRADFLRTGYGLPAGSDDDLRRRFSFCCRGDGCRKRLTPESVRFLRGVAYVAIVVVLMSAVAQGLSAARVKELTTKLKVSRQTVARWLAWWRGRVVTSPFWRERRGRFMPSLDESRLAAALVAAFEANGDEPQTVALRLLRFVASWRPAPTH